MDTVSSASLELARWLLAQEARRSKKSGSTKSGSGGNRGAGPASGSSASISADEVVRVCEKLRSVLATFAGSAGFRSLLTRALTLAKAQGLSLAGVQILEDGTLDWPERGDVESSNGPTEKVEVGAVVLVTQLLDLLIVLVGQAITLRLLSSAWPDVPTGALSSKAEESA